MNLNCPTCDSRLRDDGHCDRCQSRYEIEARGPDPWLVAGGLDLRALEDLHVYRSQRFIDRQMA